MKMRFMPGRFVVGTARAIAHKIEKPSHDDANYATPLLSEWLEEKFEKFEQLFPAPADEGLRLARQEYFERHGYYPPGDPR